MTRPGRRTGAALALTAGLLAAGCGAAAPASPAAGAAGASAPSAPAAPLTTASGSWAVMPMAGPGGQQPVSWQLFTRPAGAASWKLATPAGVDDSGGLVVVGAGGRSLVVAQRPSQALTFTPLTATVDGGAAWAPANPLDGGIADVPDALAAAPGTGQMLALLGNGAVRSAPAGAASWTAFTSERSLAATPAGRRCGLQRVTGLAYTLSGTPVLAGDCSRPGVAGIFAYAHGSWQAAGPALPAALTRQPVSVLRITLTAPRIAALLTAGDGRSASLLAAWSADDGSHWAVSRPLVPGRAGLASASFGAGSTVVVTLTGGRAAAVGAGSGWRFLPALPPGTATVSPVGAGLLDALAVQRSRLTVWQLKPAALTWTEQQSLTVPVQSG